jgi:outer membrane protein assembly factor BamB
MRLRASDGAMLGMISLPASGEVPVIVDNMVYQCQHSGTIMALRLSDGALVWRSSAYESTFTDCALKEADGVVFASILALKSNGTAAGETGQLLALNATNGQVLWRYTTPATDLLAVGDGLVVLGAGNPRAPTSLVALRAGDGSIAWRHGGFPPQIAIKGGDIPARSVAIGDGLMLVGGGGFTLWALRASDGSTAWQMKEDHHSFQTIGIVDGTVFVRSLFAGHGPIISLPFDDDNSYVLALRARDGAPYWKASLGAGGLVMGDV